MRYKPKIGKEFPVATAQPSSHEHAVIEEKTRAYIAKTIVVVAVTLVVGSSIVGLLKGEFWYLSNLWAVLSLPVGAVLGYYLPSRMGAKD